MKTLSVEKMEKIEGGVQPLQYCATLDFIMANNKLSDGALLGARIGAATANCAQFSPQQLYANWPS